MAPTDGFKMLLPAQSVTTCRCDGVVACSGETSDLAADGIRALLQRDGEADAVTNARLESSGWSIGLYGRRCVTVTGDVVRSTRSIMLPMPASHHHSTE